jgi:hypothetical protein
MPDIFAPFFNKMWNSLTDLHRCPKYQTLSESILSELRGYLQMNMTKVTDAICQYENAPKLHGTQQVNVIVCHVPADP